MAQPYNALADYQRVVAQDEDRALRREALMAQLELSRENASRADRREGRLVDYQDRQLAAGERRAQSLADIQRQQIAARRDAAANRPPQPITVADPKDPTKAVVIDANSGRLLGNAPPPKRDAAGAKIPGEIQRMNVAMGALTSGLDAYEELLKEFNPRNPMDQFNPTKRAKATALVADLQLQAKEAQALGALTGPDVEILNRLFSDPGTLTAAFYGKGGLGEQLTQARDALKRRRSSLKAQYPGADFPEPAPAAAAPAAPAAANLSPEEQKELDALRARFGKR